jgi:hypothetical protein
MSAMPVRTSGRPSDSTGTTLRWFVPDAYIPPSSTGSEVSHESICVLNRAAVASTFTVTAYFADREPEQSRPIAIAARRDLHIRTDMPDRIGGLTIERGVPYGLEIESAADLQVQYSRLDTSQAAYALMTAMLTAAPALPNTADQATGQAQDHKPINA